MAVVNGFAQRADAEAASQTGFRSLRDDGAADLVQDAGQLVGALRRYSEMMTTPGVLSDAYQHLAQELQVLSDRSAAMLSPLMTPGVAQVSPAFAHPEMEATVLPEAVLDLLGFLSKMAGRAVTFFCSPSAYRPVAVARSGFERVLVNLVKNAAEAGPAGGTVAVTLVGMRDPAQDAMVLILTVQGRGRGMSSGRLRSLTAGHRSASDAVERGIGFQLVRELAESLGGQVEAENDVDAGGSISVSWPVIGRPGKPRPELAGKPLAQSFRLSGSTVPAQTTVVMAGGEAC